MTHTNPMPTGSTANANDGTSVEGIEQGSDFAGNAEVNIDGDNAPQPASGDDDDAGNDTDPMKDFPPIDPQPAEEIPPSDPRL